ncbi:MAG: DUF6273 domain-containing protein [Anaeroplasma sp.]|uniref:DUF6273 domain-containing protein n=1 Tax=Anaeroplasma sp. TaxID=1872523 RepID=UPI002A90F504|nr:DUF6273 domain-containing protein [Anaeroplasma sp.]MDY5982558.1 DUF6273 domain-containing protein [Anaeroplasma sp.]
MDESLKELELYNKDLFLLNKCKIVKNVIVQFGRYQQEENGEVRPLKWRVLDVKSDKALLFCENIIASGVEHIFSPNTNKWEKIQIREWLNKNFYDEAFEKWEKDKINETIIDNSPKSANLYNNTKYFNDGINKYCTNKTLDKVFLLSIWDITNPNYGFKNDIKGDSLRQKIPTKYVLKLEKSSLYALSSYYLRSPHHNYYFYGYCIESKNGCLRHGYSDDRRGIVPAIVISTK